MDLVIRGGTVVTVGETFVADVGVEGERVAQIGGEMSAPREIDASGKLLVPGGVDMHVHLQIAEAVPEGTRRACRTTSIGAPLALLPVVSLQSVA